jgi:Antibiotic biosynthesis monooxygenase
MYVQLITLRAPNEQIGQLRTIISGDYLSVISKRPGFVAAHLLEEIDDPESAKLLIYWDNQSSAEIAQATGVLSGSINAVAAQMPGLRIQRQSYIVNVTTDKKHTVAV